MKKRKRITNRQAILVAALASVGLSLVAYGQNLAFEEVSFAAPAPAATPSAKPSPAANATGSAAVAGPNGTNPEFGGQVDPSQSGGRIRSTSQETMVRRARENAGREDPFIALTLPTAIVIAPIAPPPQRVSRPISVVPPPESLGGGIGVTPRQVVRRYDQVTGRWVEEIITVNPDEPKWSVQGILNTGREALVVLELDGVTREAHIGEVLEDGSKVVAISGQQITLLSRGRRYVKTIGGQDTP